MSYFEFKKFRIYHDRCAMKVGTDGVLLGSWAKVDTSQRILDIGCGSGVVALMAAQRSESAQVVGVELDAQAAKQAAENCSASPFAHRLCVICADIADYNDENKFDCILSNPPFFEESVLPPDTRRATARHTHGLSITSLISHATRLMRPQALFQVILPYSSKSSFIEKCALKGLYLTKQTEVITREGKLPKRVLLSFINAPHTQTADCNELVLLDKDSNQRSKAYSALTEDFYL